MKKRLFLIALVLGILLLAFGGWSVEGFRWLLTGSRHSRRSTLQHGRAPQPVLWARPAVGRV